MTSRLCIHHIRIHYVSAPAPVERPELPQQDPPQSAEPAHICPAGSLSVYVTPTSKRYLALAAAWLLITAVWTVSWVAPLHTVAQPQLIPLVVLCSAMSCLGYLFVVARDQWRWHRWLRATNAIANA